MHLEAEGHLDMDNPIHRIALFLVYYDRIQASLNRAAAAWNKHGMRTEKGKSPQIMWHLSRCEATRLGYWEDPGDGIDIASDFYYGVDGQGPIPSAEELEDEMDSGVRMHDDAVLAKARSLLGDIDLNRNDRNRGMDVYLEVAERLTAILSGGDESDSSSD